MEGRDWGLSDTLLGDEKLVQCIEMYETACREGTSLLSSFCNCAKFSFKMKVRDRCVILLLLTVFTNI